MQERLRHTLAVNCIRARVPHSIGRELQFWASPWGAKGLDPTSGVPQLFRLPPEGWGLQTMSSENQWDVCPWDSWDCGKWRSSGQWASQHSPRYPLRLSPEKAGKITYLSVSPWKGFICILEKSLSKGHASNLAGTKVLVEIVPRDWELVDTLHPFSLQPAPVIKPSSQCLIGKCLYPHMAPQLLWLQLEGQNPRPPVPSIQWGFHLWFSGWY